MIGGRRKGFVLSLIAFLLLGAILFLSSELAASSARQYEQFGPPTQMLGVADAFQMVTELLSRNDTAFGLFGVTFSGNTTSLTDGFPYPSLPEQTLLNRIAFVANRSRYDISADIANGAPGIVSIYPQRVYVLHPDVDSMTIAPESNQSGNSIVEFSLRLEMATNVTPIWAEENSVPSDSPDALHVIAVGFNANSSDNQTLDGYVNHSMVNQLIFTTPYGNATYATFGNGTVGKLDVVNDLNASSPYTASALLYTNVTANDSVGYISFGPVLSNVSVSFGSDFRMSRQLGLMPSR